MQYAVEEAREAGIEQFIFVTGRGKHIIEDHFDHAYELESLLTAREKTEELDSLLESLPTSGSVSFTRQQSPLGLGHAVWCARHLVGDEPFAVLLPDDLLVGKPGALSQMMKAAQFRWRRLRKYVREEHALTIEDAIRKFTALPAQRMRFTDRGVLKQEMWADIVIFDPSTIRDLATFEQPNQLSQGMEYVLVNGVPVIAGGKMTGALPGKVLRGAGYQSK